MSWFMRVAKRRYRWGQIELTGRVVMAGRLNETVSYQVRPRCAAAEAFSTSTVPFHERPSLVYRKRVFGVDVTIITGNVRCGRLVACRWRSSRHLILQVPLLRLVRLARFACFLGCFGRLVFS